MCECDWTYVNTEYGVVGGEVFRGVYFSSVEFYFI